MAAILVANLYHARLSLIAQQHAGLTAKQVGCQCSHQLIALKSLFGGQQERRKDVIDPVSERKGAFVVDLLYHADGASLLKGQRTLDLDESNEQQRGDLLGRNLHKVERIVHCLAEFVG